MGVLLPWDQGPYLCPLRRDIEDGNSTVLFSIILAAFLATMVAGGPDGFPVCPWISSPLPWGR